ncbi:hypothetical protein NQ317_012197 [Molorchus minor]|uniref:Uncharacterized protein n=1 Tax=Molorchus minor TaxID=1323400 RepID=A0ABQ9K3P2_9CUCU|nr:hypothetical protein NQ317_012197 [Molorchus minor]
MKLPSGSPPDSENRYSDSFAGIRVVPPVKDNRRSSWSVADKVRTTDESQSMESEVTFGEGEATVVENDGFYGKDRHPTWPRMENLTKDATERLNEGQTNIEVSRNSSSRYTNPSNYSPIALRKAIPVMRPDLKSAVTTEKLSSPSLVGRNYGSVDYAEILEPRQNGRQSPSKEFKNSVDRKLQAKHIHDSIVLRQPRKSEMTYFGVKLSPKPVKKISQAVIRKENNKTTKNAATSKTKPRQKSPDNTKIHSGPIYENLKEAKGRYTREFDSSILDELTKAADQILQAVNGYTDEDPHARLSTDEESKKRIEPLDTISETKSWKQQKAKAANTKPPNTKTRLKHTSSTSSVESITCSRRHTSVERKPAPARTAPERKKKSEKGESSVAKANTKARRLQRASSREALLQSHGSSSEDLAANVEMPIRKPRLIKKTKGVQLTVSNGFDIKKMPSSATGKRKEEGSSRSEERILGSLPEIRHKTAVSTIRSTADKTTREKTKHREELRKRRHQKGKYNSITNRKRTDKTNHPEQGDCNAPNLNSVCTCL